MNDKTDGKRSYTFHFVGTDSTFTTRMSYADHERLFGENAKTFGFVTFWDERTVTVNMQNVTYVEVGE